MSPSCTEALGTLGWQMHRCRHLLSHSKNCDVQPQKDRPARLRLPPHPHLVCGLLLYD